MGIPMRADGYVRWAIDWPASVTMATRFRVEPEEAGGLAIETVGEDGRRATALLAGGIAGRRYRLTAQTGRGMRTLDIVAEGW